jgi:hypothetical protein
MPSTMNRSDFNFENIERRRLLSKEKKEESCWLISHKRPFTKAHGANRDERIENTSKKKEELE